MVGPWARERIGLTQSVFLFFFLADMYAVMTRGQEVRGLRSALKRDGA